jgi:hypothetical protein
MAAEWSTTSVPAVPRAPALKGRSPQLREQSPFNHQESCMLSQPHPRRRLRRAVSAAARLLVRAIQIALLLLLVVLPVPAALLMTRLIRSDRRRTVATQTLRKE